MISAPRHKSPSGIYLFGKGSMLRSRPHDYVAVYRVPKFVLVQKLWTLQNGLKIFSGGDGRDVFTFFPRRFDQLLVIQLTSNFVHTFYRAFPRGFFLFFRISIFFSSFETLKLRNFEVRFDTLVDVRLTSYFVQTFYRAFPGGNFFIFLNFEKMFEFCRFLNF